jgi:hypothetical protein
MATNNSTDNYTALTTKGDLYAYSTFATRLPIGSNYYFVQADSTQAIGLSYQLPILQDQIASNTHIDFFGTVAGGDSAISTATSGTGSSAALVNSIDNAHLGLIKLDMGTTTTGHASCSSNNTATPILLNGATITIETDIYLSALSNGTDTYTLNFGVFDTSYPFIASNGAYIAYSSGVNSGNWTVTINNATSLTTSNGSTAPTAATWYKLRLVIGTNTVTGYVGVAGSDFSSIATVNATLPTANLFFAVGLLKSAGTTDTFAYVDYLSSKTIYSTKR